MSYVVAAWVATVLLLGGYAYSVHRRRVDVEREIRRLRAELGEGAAAGPYSPSPSRRDAALGARIARSDPPPSDSTIPEPASPESASPDSAPSDSPPS